MNRNFLLIYLPKQVFFSKLCLDWLTVITSFKFGQSASLIAQLLALPEYASLGTMACSLEIIHFLH